MTGRERVTEALSRRPTDRIPVAMVCSGINEPARTHLEHYLRETRGLTVSGYLEPIIDVVSIFPKYIGPDLPPKTDIWASGAPRYAPVKAATMR